MSTVDEETRRKIAEIALSFEGTRFHHQGRLPGTGLDCIGVVVCAGQAAGLRMVDHTAYGRNPNPRVLLAYIDRNFERIDEADAGIGDVLLYWFRSPEVPQHGALIVNHPARVGPSAMHAHAGARVVTCCAREAPEFANRVHSAWRYKKEPQ